MIVPDKIRKCVAFIGYQMSDDSFRMAGSLFFLGEDQDGKIIGPTYAVTARHVIDGIRNLGLNEVLIRLNLKNNQATWFKTKLEEWYYDDKEYSDVAVLRISFQDNFDHLIQGYSGCITQDILRSNEVGLGDEVFITGLFRHHHGNLKNIPIVRVGNIACLNEEQVITKYGSIDAYLIEARSIGGLSGSPVFLNLGITRYIENSVKHAQGGPIIYLMGLIHGHYDVADNAVDNIDDDSNDPLSRLNSKTHNPLIY